MQSAIPGLRSEGHAPRGPGSEVMRCAAKNNRFIEKSRFPRFIHVFIHLRYEKSLSFPSIFLNTIFLQTSLGRKLRPLVRMGGKRKC